MQHCGHIHVGGKNFVIQGEIGEGGIMRIAANEPDSRRTCPRIVQSEMA